MEVSVNKKVRDCYEVYGFKQQLTYLNDKTYMKTLLIITSCFIVVYLISCSNKPVNSYLYRYEQVIDSIIAGYDSKDVDIYVEAQYRIASLFGIVYDIIGDTLLSKSDKEYLADKIDQAESTWCADGSGMFSKVTFITDTTGEVVEQVNVQYWVSDVSILQVWMPVENIQLVLANWELDTISNYHHLEVLPQENGCFVSYLEDQQVLRERNTLFILGYKEGAVSTQVMIPLKMLHKQLQEKEQ